MPNAASFESFEKELNRLVGIFERNLAELKSPGYDEASLRQEFLNPFLRALGWDLENKAGLIPAHREVVVESRTDIGRADYLFRIARKPRFVCEAKKPAEELPGHAHQAKSYAWTIGLPLAVLTDFEELNIYIVGGEPKEDEPLVGLWKTYPFREYVAKARELWDLLARDNVAGGSIDRLVESLPKKPLRLGKGQFVIRPDPTQNFDAKFLNFLDGARRSLASDLLRHNEQEDWQAGLRLNDAVQCILDRLLFIRISEARGIDMGTKLQSLLETWQKRQKRSDALHDAPPAHWGGAGLAAPRGSLWNSIVRHIRALDRRPPSHVPFFNGNLFKLHFTEELVVGDDWLEEFLESIGNEYSAYKFGYVAVEILGTIYERFLGKIVRPHGRGAVIEEKPEVRKAGGVYYTPRYIVEYIVEQTVGRILEGKKPEETLKLRFLDPACGSGSFLLRVFERVCEHWQQWLTDNPNKQKKDWCWLDEKANTVHLTARLKRRILRETIYGVDLDPQAVEVTQLSLYLKMLEGETADTIQRETGLFGGDEAILPPLQDNIKCGNSLIASDFSMMPEDLVRVHAFDWPVQFAPIMRAGGFDAVVGNPPWVSLTGKFGNEICSSDEIVYLTNRYNANTYMPNLYEYFVSQGFNLTKSQGRFSFIVPDRLGFNAQFVDLRKRFLTEASITTLQYKFPFPGITAETLVFSLQRTPPNTATEVEIVEYGKTPMRRKQAELLGSNGHAFEYFENLNVMRLVGKLATNPYVKPLGEMFETTSGFGGKSELITESQVNQRQTPTMKGDSISKYNTRKKYWFEFAPKNITGRTTDRTKLGARPKILLRKTGNSIIATYDDSGIFPEQSLYFLFNKKTDSDFKFVLGLLNSQLMNVFFKAKCLTNKDSIAQVKKVDLDLLPIVGLNLKDSADKTRHDKLVLLVDKLLGLMPKLRAVTSEREKATLQNAITAANQQIDVLVYELYGLTEKEIKLVEGGQ
jgi:type I restriction-modification system DNA methylase subunit